jgi:serine/threonine protein kinase
MELEERNLASVQEIYRDSQGRAKVYFAKLLTAGEPYEVAVKAIRCSGNLEIYSYIEECLNQLKIDSPNVCKIYGWVIKPSEILIVMERLGYDLSKEIALRRKADYSYTEMELLALLKDLTRVFALLQRLNISHNDIKAENIFVQKLAQGKVVFKVGDFGSAAKAHRWERALSGTPLYLSPHLKAEYQRFLRTRERREILYDPFKSDVYSLGITLIYLAELACPNDLMDTTYLQDRLQAHLATIRHRYPKLAILMTSMLETDESKRYDFLTLEAQLRGVPGLEESTLPELEQSVKACSFIAEFEDHLKRSYEREDWEFMQVLLRAHASELKRLRAVSRLQQCPNCACEQGRVQLCTVCGRPTGFSSIDRFSSYFVCNNGNFAGYHANVFRVLCEIRVKSLKNSLRQHISCLIFLQILPLSYIY